MSEKFQTTRGMRDFLPELARKKQYIEDVCRKVFERYGFQPLETPAVEDFELLSAKGAAVEEIKKEIYYFKDQGDRELGLRFDFTVPLARVVAINPQLTKPFKRYQIGKVWRYDRPGKGRYREFTQADIDIIGTSSMVADVECLLATIDVFRALGLDFVIKVNNRKLLEDIAIASGVKKEQVVDCFRSIDKLEKIGRDGVIKELDDKKIETKVLEIIEGNNLEIAEKIVGKTSEGLKELKELMDLAKGQGIEKYLQVELSLARGLEYYTGTVFEVAVKGELQLSCGGGGRYDNLIQVYGGQKSPAVGISYGVERLLEILEKKLDSGSKTRVFVAAISENLQKDALQIVQKIRELGIPAEMDLMGRNISKNLDYANKQGIQFVAILGENELKAGQIKLKDMKSGKETMVKISEIAKLKEIIGN